MKRIVDHLFATKQDRIIFTLTLVGAIVFAFFTFTEDGYMDWMSYIPLAIATAAFFTFLVYKIVTWKWRA